MASVLTLPKNEEWGPVLWEFLHGLLEKSGKSVLGHMLLDQRREILVILKNLELVMPCQLCRKHYSEWRKLHPPDRLPQGAEFFPVIRKWLYDLHCNVNTSRSVETTVAFEDLSMRYGSVNLYRLNDTLMEMLSRASQLRAINGEAFKTFRSHCILLQRFF